MNDKKLIEDLENIAYCSHWDRTDAKNVAVRAIEEIESLKNEIYIHEMEAAGEDY